MVNLLDSHTHTIASGHAYNTVTEMVSAAAAKGLKLLGITEHCVKMPGTCPLLYFMNLKVLPREMMGIEVLYGTELNILDFDGKVDMKPNLLRKMDVTVASLHIVCIDPGTMAENTRATIRAIENPLINIIGHPDDGRFPVDFDEIAAAAKEHHTLLELNNSSARPGGGRVNAAENDRILLEKCMKYGTHIILDSDAHWADDIGRTDISGPILEEVGFPEELIVNRSVEEYKTYVNRYRRE